MANDDFLHQLRWLYIGGDDRQIHGPFPSTEMNKWLTGNFFQPNLMLKLIEDHEFYSLEQLVQACGNENPFSVPGNSYQAVVINAITIVQHHQQQQQRMQSVPMSSGFSSLRPTPTSTPMPGPGGFMAVAANVQQFQQPPPAGSLMNFQYVPTSIGGRPLPPSQFLMMPTPFPPTIGPNVQQIGAPPLTAAMFSRPCPQLPPMEETRARGTTGMVAGDFSSSMPDQRLCQPIFDQHMVASSSTQQNQPQPIFHQSDPTSGANPSNWTTKAREIYKKWGNRTLELRVFFPKAMLKMEQDGRKEDGCHTPQSFLNYAFHYVNKENPDKCQSNEKIWGAVTLALKIFAGDLGIGIYHHDVQKEFVQFIDNNYSQLGVDESGIPKLKLYFANAEDCHRKFYDDGGDPTLITESIWRAVHFINELGRIHWENDRTKLMEGMLEFQRIFIEKKLGGMSFPIPVPLIDLTTNGQNGGGEGGAHIGRGRGEGGAHIGRGRGEGGAHIGRGRGEGGAHIGRGRGEGGAHIGRGRGEGGAHIGRGRGEGGAHIGRGRGEGDAHIGRGRGEGGAHIGRGRGEGGAHIGRGRGGVRNGRGRGEGGAHIGRGRGGVRNGRGRGAK